MLFYRAMDVSRMAGLTMGEAEGQRKLDDMTSFAQDLFTCRKMYVRHRTSSAIPPDGTNVSCLRLACTQPLRSLLHDERLFAVTGLGDGGRPVRTLRFVSRRTKQP